MVSLGSRLRSFRKSSLEIFSGFMECRRVSKPFWFELAGLRKAGPDGFQSWSGRPVVVRMLCCDGVCFQIKMAFRATRNVTEVLIPLSPMRCPIWIDTVAYGACVCF